MKYKILPIDDIYHKNRWDVGFYTKENEVKTSTFQTIRLGDILKERKAAIEPSSYPTHIFNYIGLENISSATRLLVNFEPKRGLEIKSRSKIFRHGDILYGRMRPTLNKVLRIDSQVTEGICSNEIFVLYQNSDLVNPIYLEELLTSEWVQQAVARLVGGATMPRINISDFLNIEIPLPSIDQQNSVSEILSARRKKWLKSFLYVNEEPHHIKNAMMSFIESGKFEIQMEDLAVRTWQNKLPDFEIF